MGKTKALMREAMVGVIVAIPAAATIAVVIALAKITCGLVWHSPCQLRATGIHRLDEPIQISQTHIRPGLIVPIAIGD